MGIGERESAVVLGLGTAVVYSSDKYGKRLLEIRTVFIYNLLLI